MDAENKESGETKREDTPVPTQEAPRTRLRDLRPEKDPIGAGRPRTSDKSTQRQTLGD